MISIDLKCEMDEVFKQVLGKKLLVIRVDQNFDYLLNGSRAMQVFADAQRLCRDCFHGELELVGRAPLEKLLDQVVAKRVPH